MNFDEIATSRQEKPGLVYREICVRGSAVHVVSANPYFLSHSCCIAGTSDDISPGYRPTSDK